MEKENLLLRILKGIKNAWKRLGQEDVMTEEDFSRDRNINAQVARLQAIQAEVHNKRDLEGNAQFNEYKEQIHNQVEFGKSLQVSDYDYKPQDPARNIGKGRTSGMELGEM